MDCQALESLFLSDTSKAIEECKKMICSISKFDSFQDFTSYHLKNVHFYYCPKPFNAKIIPRISIYCIDCAKGDGLNLICLPCFLNGNHEGHNYFIFPGFIGNCDCGDKLHLNCSCFCSNHQGFEDDENIDNYLDENLRSVLINIIFTSSFKALQRLQQTDTHKSSQIKDFIISFFNLGDGFRRLYVRAITQESLLNDLIYNIQGCPSADILSIFSYLMHDQLFMRNLSKSVISFIFDKAIKNSSEDMLRQPNNISSNNGIWYQFIYTCFSEHFYRWNIENNGWDWVTFSIELLKQYKKLLFLFKSDKYTKYPLVFNIIKYIQYATSIEPNEKTQEFFDKIFTEVFNTGITEPNDTIIVESYKKFSVSTQIDSYLDFLKTFGDLMNSFKSKEKLKVDKLIEELDKSLDIAPIYLISKNSIDDENNSENDKLITRFIIKKDETKSLYSIFKSKIKSLFHSFPSKYYKSFYNGASFFICHPLYDSFSMLFRVDNLCRIKLARFLCQEKYQSLRVKLGIVTLKRILSIFCFKLGLIQLKNLTILILLEKIYNDKTEIVNNLIPISVFQLLIGLQCNEKTKYNCMTDEFILKEFFSFELAREIGMFDNKLSTKKDLLVFTFLYILLMIVIDRNLFNYEYKNVLEEQIIFALKKGVHSIDELHDLLNANLNLNPKEYFTLFNEIIMKVARNSTKDDSLQNDDNDDTNISLQSFGDTKLNEEDDDYDDNDDDSESIKNKMNIKSIINNKEDTKKENPNSYIKPINFYLKDEIECNAISAVNPIDAQRSYLNVEISKNSGKLLKIQNFESEEKYFFNQNDELNIHLKQFLQTPTALAIIYDTLRSSSELNNHLAMNILILISRFINEDSERLSNITSTFNSQEIIQYNSILDLISKLKHIVFNYRSSGEDINEKVIIENTLNSTNFISLLKMKFEPQNLPPKSIIDILKDKEQLGQDVLRQISTNIHINLLDESENEIKIEEKDLKTIQKAKIKKLKDEIMNQFSNIRNDYCCIYSTNESISLSSSGLLSLNKEVCSFCSESKKNEILCFPLYIYRTKFPFIIDKPPLVSSEEVNDIAVYDYEDDFDKDMNITEYIENELGIKKGRENQEKMRKFNELKKLVSDIFDQQRKEKDELVTKKRVTLGANFVIQYGICPHQFHRSCVIEDQFVCPIDRSKKNGFLPYLEEIPKSVIFKNLETFELSSSCDNNNNSLSSNVVDSISAFIDKFKSFFDDSISVFIELIKSISGLIETYEIRVRNLPDSLDSVKTKVLARNLFLTVWYAYRIQKKPKVTMMSKNDSKEIDVDSRLTDFQKFIKLLIELDDIDSQNIALNVKKLAHSITKSMISQKQENVKRKEKEICLFLRRVCLTEYFLLNVNVSIDVRQDLVDWDDVLTTENLSKRYDFNFTTINVVQNEEFVFKPLFFTKFPKEFLRLSEAPYNLPISEVLNTTMFNILDYNYLIKYYDDFDDTNENENNTNNDNESSKIKSNINNDEEKRYSRAVYTCDNEFLTFFLNFYGKMHYPSILMFTGVNSSQIFLVDQSQGAALETPYVDKSGCPDINHVRMQPLFLSEERYEKLIEEILSGDFSYKLSSLEEEQTLFSQGIESSDLF